jgi:hypothetical protein
MDSNYFFRHAIHKYDYRNKSIQVLEDMSMNSRDPLSAFFSFALFVTSKIESSNCPILEFKVLQNAFKFDKQGLK